MNISDSSIKKTISISNLILTIVLTIILKKNYPCLLALLLIMILGYIMIKTIDNEQSIYDILIMGFLLFLSLRIIKINKSKKTFLHKIQNSVWEFAYITIILSYVLSIKN